MDLPFGGAEGWMVQGENQQVVFVEFGERLDVPEHVSRRAVGVRHRRKGGTEDRRGDRSFRSGDNFFIPAGKLHAATVHAGYKALIVFNERDRYRAKK